MMELNIRIHIDKDDISGIAQEAVRSSFRKGQYGASDGSGYDSIVKQVDTFINSIDFSDIISEEYENVCVSEIINEVIMTSMKNRIRKTLREMNKSGDLWPDIKKMVQDELFKEVK